MLEKVFERTARVSDREAGKEIKKLDLKGLEASLESVVFQKEQYKPNDVESLARLVYKLREQITTYDSVVSDDTSGRLPSIILWKLMNKKRKAEGKEAVRLYFLAGARYAETRFARAQPILDFLTSYKHAIGKKVLLSTEYISSGSTIGFLGDLLRMSNISYTVSSVSVNPMYVPASSRNEKDSQSFVYGTRSNEDPRLCKKGMGKGVVKYSLRPSAHPELEVSSCAREQVILARRDINRIVEVLYTLL